MNHTLNKALRGLVVMAVIIFSLTGCYESHYYHHYHHHTRDWYDHHHMPPPAGVDFNIDVR